MSVLGIEEQKNLLETITTQNAKVLHDSGIISRALHGGELAPTITPRVTRKRNRGTGGEYTTDLTVALFDVTSDSKSNIVNRVRGFTVARQIGSILVPEPGFTDSDAHTVAGMVEALEMEQAFGDLPNLDPQLSDIYNPHTGMVLRDSGSQH